MSAPSAATSATAATMMTASSSPRTAAFTTALTTALSGMRRLSFGAVEVGLVLAFRKISATFDGDTFSSVRMRKLRMMSVA